MENRKIVKFFRSLEKFNKKFQISKIFLKVKKKFYDFTKFINPFFENI